jgi:hypothetical protein
MIEKLPDDLLARPTWAKEIISKSNEIIEWINAEPKRRAERTKKDKYGADFHAKIGAVGGKIGGLSGKPQGTIKGFAVKPYKKDT